jgi:hypothetical protein
MNQVLSSKLAEVSQLVSERAREVQARQLTTMLAVKDACERGLWCVECLSQIEFVGFSDGAAIMPIFSYSAWCKCPTRLPALPMVVTKAEG